LKRAKRRKKKTTLQKATGIEDLPITYEDVGDGARQIFSVYLKANDNLIVGVHGGVFEEPGMWGLVFADMLKHLVDCIPFAPKGEVQAMIYEIMGKELASPTTKLTGRFVDTEDDSELN